MAKQDEDEGKNIGEDNEIENGPPRPRHRQKQQQNKRTSVKTKENTGLPSKTFKQSIPPQHSWQSSEDMFL
jgi:hypothetical protein